MHNRSNPGGPGLRPHPRPRIAAELAPPLPVPTSRGAIPRHREGSAGPPQAPVSSAPPSGRSALRPLVSPVSAPHRALAAASPSAPAADRSGPLTSDASSSSGWLAPSAPHRPSSAHRRRRLLGWLCPASTPPRPPPGPDHTALPHSSAPPLAGWRLACGATPPPLRSIPVAGTASLRRGVPPLGTAAVLSPSGVFHVRFSVPIGAPGSHVPSHRLGQAQAAVMPDAAPSVHRVRRSGSRGHDSPRL
jgi:hypothetical protein